MFFWISFSLLFIRMTFGARTFKKWLLLSIKRASKVQSGMKMVLPILQNVHELYRFFLTPLAMMSSDFTSPGMFEFAFYFRIKLDVNLARYSKFTLQNHVPFTPIHWTCFSFEYLIYFTINNLFIKFCSRPN